MSKGRKNGCPTNIRDWQISILDPDAPAGTWVNIRGLNTLTRSEDSRTADGSAGSDLWEEPYITKRSVTVKLNGRAVGCPVTGEKDPGQELLDSYARESGCAGDATLRFADPYGHAMEADFVVTAAGKEANQEENSISWELRQVGEAEILPYVPVQAVTLTPAALQLTPGGEAEPVQIGFVPENASNRRYRISVNGKSVAAVSEVSESGFAVSALTAGNAVITVTSQNGRKTASVAVTAEEA